jgi:hypothetical protein
MSPGAALHSNLKTQTGGAGKVLSANVVLMPKFPPPPAAGPVEVRDGVIVVAGVQRQDPAVGQHDLAFDHLIAGETVHPHVEADAAAEHETRNSDGRAAAVGDRDVGLAQRRIEDLVARAGADPHDAGSRIEIGRVHHRHVDGESGRHRVARIAVATRARDERHAVLTAPPDRLGDIRSAGAQCDARRPDVGIAQIVREIEFREVEVGRPQHWSENPLGEITPRGIADAGRVLGEDGIWPDAELACDGERRRADEKATTAERRTGESHGDASTTNELRVSE